jgi:hypothetical protein
MHVSFRYREHTDPSAWPSKCAESQSLQLPQTEAGIYEATNKPAIAADDITTIITTAPGDIATITTTATGDITTIITSAYCDFTFYPMHIL